MRRTTWLVVGLFWFASAEFVSGQPKLSHITPGGLTPGGTVDVTLHGENLSDPLRVWTSFPAEVELQPSNEEAPKLRRCRVRIADGVPLGVGGMFVASPTGVSDLHFVLIDDLPSIADSAANHSLQTAQFVEIPSAVDAVLDGPKLDYYGFSVAAGQSITCEVFATRLASNSDPVVRLLDAAGNELLMVDDDISFGPDCRFQYRFQQAGDYFLEIRDNRFRGGARCRIRLGDFPLVSVPYPLGGRVGSTASFRFIGPAAEGALPVVMRVPAGSDLRQISISAKYSEGRPSGITRAAASRLPEQLEAEPNDAPERATSITLPCAVSGLLEQESDRDYYSFAALKGSSYVFRGVCQKLGSPTRLFMQIHNADGKTLAETQLKELDESVLKHRFPADGRYVLSVQDLLRRHGPEHGYRIEAEEEQGFSLAVKKENGASFTFQPASNRGAFKLKLQVTRQGYDGPIQLDVAAHGQRAEDEAGSSAGLQLLDSIIPAKAKEHSVIVVVPEKTTPGNLATVRMAGSAVVRGERFSAPVVTAALVRDKWPHMVLSPAWLDGLLTVVAGEQAEELFDLSLEKQQTEPATDDSHSLKWVASLERKKEEFKGGLTLMVKGLPVGYSYSVEKVKDKDEYEITVRSQKNPLSGRCELVAYGELNGKGLVICKPIRLAGLGP